MAEDQHIVNSLLCFINSARNDYSHDTLLETANSFYSHEEIKKGKEILCNILKADIVWRRNPDKKKNDLIDVLEFHEKCKKNKFLLFVTDSYKRMPPVGLEIFGPMLRTLAEDIARINELLPSILDIKAEVCNTTDTIRDMKMDVKDLKNKFEKAVEGMEEAAKDMTTNEAHIIDDLTSFKSTIGNEIASPRRVSIVEEGNAHTEIASPKEVNQVEEGNVSGSYAETLRDGVVADVGKSQRHSRGGASGGRRSSTRDGARTEMRMTRLTRGSMNVAKAGSSEVTGVKDGTSMRTERDEGRDVLRVGNSVKDWVASSPAVLVTDSHTGAVSKSGPRPPVRKQRFQSISSLVSGDSPVHQGKDGVNKWHTVETKKKRFKHQQFRGITGIRKSDSFKGARRTLDVFLGRVDTGVTCEGIKEHIRDVINIDIIDIRKLEIRSEEFNAFKVTVNAVDRDKLLNGEMWPEDVIVDKFYNKTKIFSDKEVV